MNNNIENIIFLEKMLKEFNYIKEKVDDINNDFEIIKKIGINSDFLIYMYIKSLSIILLVNKFMKKIEDEKDEVIYKNKGNIAFFKEKDDLFYYYRNLILFENEVFNINKSIFNLIKIIENKIS